MEKVKTNGKEGKALINNILSREKAIINNSIKATENALHMFESKYGLKSSTFLKKYLSGKMGDDAEVMVWAAQIQSLRRLKTDLNSLSGIKIVS